MKIISLSNPPLYQVCSVLFLYSTCIFESEGHWQNTSHSWVSEHSRVHTSEARDVIFSKCTKNYFNPSYVHEHAHTIVGFSLCSMRRNSPLFTFIDSWLLTSLGYLCLETAAGRMCAHFVLVNFTSVALWPEAHSACPFLCISPALFFWVSCSHSMKETFLLQFSIYFCWGSSWLEEVEEGISGRKLDLARRNL